MGIISILLLIVFVISSILLILIVMMQGESGDELGGIFGGGMNQQMGMRSGNIMTRITGILGTIFFLCAFGMAWVNRTPDIEDVTQTARELEERVEWWLDDDAESEAEDEATLPPDDVNTDNSTIEEIQGVETSSE